ncbi:putative serine/threonine protein kinase [Actinoplanes friuliensis DSM 7358]|uniref:non-specific serine/threonine protein kinase n=2 Tax=Actinoplanes friuliensis TaxID=196914 RepID=U5VY17_9ACTN|nr:putative serine/threonine protein kinase [Actinoplanes friuliensis DSM 7358]
MASRYRLVSRLETGGMAQIWHADDELLDRPVALKLPSGLDPARADVLHLAWKEARMAARLSHPNIAAVHDYNAAMRPEGFMAPFVVMELLAGESLAARLDRSPLSWQESAGIGIAVADALTAAHANGVVHRDIKPGNVMLTPTGVKILDFGISAATGEPDDDETGVTFGTPAYVAPERLDGKPAEPATDVYGLGVLLYEMVTGDPPYPVDTWEELDAARTAPPRSLPAELPVAFRELVELCLREEPDRRPTAAHVSRELAALTPPAAPPAPRKKRRVALFSGLAALVVSLIALFAALGSSRQSIDAAPSTAPSAAPSAAPSGVTPRSAPASTRPAAPPTARATPTPTPTAAAPLRVDDAIDRVRATVRTGRESGQIRPDVAQDLLNLLQPLGRAEAADVSVRVEELQRKVQERTDEGSVDEARADLLSARLADLSRAAERATG